MFQQRVATTTPNVYSEQPSPHAAPQQQQANTAVATDATRANKPAAPPKPNHKVVIYFGDSIANRGKHNVGETAKDVVQAAQLLDDTAPNVVAPKQDSAECLGSKCVNDDDLPSYIESVQNGVINIKIEGNYQRASALVQTVAKPTLATVHVLAEAEQLAGGVEDNASQQSCDSCDWSFVQEWRARYAVQKYI